jgi:malonate transporter
MLTVLGVTFPFFALVLVGYVAARRGWMPLTAIPGLNTFVLFFALPCMLFRFGVTTDMVQLLQPAVWMLYWIVAVLVVGVTVWLTRAGGMGWNDAALGALVAAFPNTGFMGVPLLVGLLGVQASAPAIITILIDLVITSSLCIALSRLDGAGLAGARTAARRALRGVLSNPMPWAILLGAWFSIMQWQLPHPVQQSVWMLADAASPAALFTIGAVLARAQLVAPTQTRIAAVWPVVGIKLILHPALVLVGAWLFARLGWPIERETLTALVLVAALPSASNVSILAERSGADTGRIARIILLTTALAFITFSVAVYGLHPGPASG